MMRTWFSGISSVSATPERAMNGTWVDDQTVTFGALPLGDHGMRLDRHRVRHVGHIAALDHRVGGGHRGIGIALGDRRV